MDEQVLSQKRTFDLLDYGVFGFMLGISAAVGIYHAWKSRKSPDSIKEYLVGGQNMSVFPISMSLVASYISGIGIMGFPAEMYVYGTQLLTALIAEGFICLTLMTVFLPVFFHLRVTSTYEYLELRFNRYVRLVGSIMFIIDMMLYIPIVMYIPALALNHVTTIDLNIVTPLVCAICIFYTTLGGLKAVVWTDTIQTVIMFGGVIVVVILGTIEVGGMSEVWKKNSESGRIEFFNMNLDPTIRHTFWSIVFGGYMHGVAICGVSQVTVQRYLAISNLKKSNITIMMMSVGIVSIDILTGYCGLVIYAAYHGCDPVISKQIEKADQLMPFFVMKLAKSIPGLPGLFVASVFSAALSTMSTGLNSMVGIIYEDMIKPLVKKPLTERVASGILKIMVVIIGVICVGCVFLVSKLSSIIHTAKSLSGITTGPMLGVFTLGMFFPAANSAGALTGALSGFIFVAWISFGTQAAISAGTITFPVKNVSIEGCPEYLQKKPANLSIIDESISSQPFFLYRMSYLWYTGVGFLTTIVIGLFVSWLTGPNKYKTEDKKLYTPVIHHFLSPKMSKNKNITELNASSVANET